MGRQSTTVRMPLEGARAALLAQALEENERQAGKWGDELSDRFTAQAVHEQGEASAEKLLAARAEAVLKHFRQKGADVSAHSHEGTLRLAGLLFVAAAFALGAAVDRLTGSEGMVNLLSLPYWGVVLWNLAVYAAILCFGVATLGRKPFAMPLRRLMASVSQRLAFPLVRLGWKQSFWSRWAALTLPLARLRVSRLLHWAAAAFACGLVVSILLRGLGTSYWAGWESTWLADRPDIVKAFLDWTYGLVPAWAGAGPMPGLEGVSALRADRAASAAELSSAGPWLIRMCWIMLCAVVVPRLLLGALALLRERRLGRRLPLDVSDPYFRRILEKGNAGKPLAAFHLIAASTAEAARQGLAERLRADLSGGASGICAQADPYAEEASAPRVPAGSGIAGILFDAAETPEPELHEALMERAAAACREAGCSPVVLLDMTAFERRQKVYPERLVQRREAWEAAAERHGVPLLAFGREGDGVAELAGLLRLHAAAALPGGAKAEEGER